MKFGEFAGNAYNIHALKEMIRSGRICGAFIFEGADGSGKSQFARTFAKAIVCSAGEHKKKHGEACGTCNACKKFDMGIHPDIIIEEPEADKSDGFHIEQIRNITDGLYLTPNESETKVYILEDAQKMSVSAQNALLKSLEEPPPFAVFMLIISGGGTVLETVKSRAVKIKMDYIESDVMREYLEKYCGETAPEKIKSAVKLSNGSIGAAKNILNGNVEESADINSRVNRLIYGRENKSDILGVLESFTQKTVVKSELLIFYSALEAAARDMLVAKIFMNSGITDGKEICESFLYFDNYEDIEDSVNLYPVENILQLIKKIHDFKADLDYNVNARLNVTSFLAAL